MAPITAFFQQAGQARAKATPVLIVLDDAAQTPSVKPSKPPAVGQDAATLISPADDRVCQVSPEARAQVRGLPHAPCLAADACSIAIACCAGSISAPVSCSSPWAAMRRVAVLANRGP